MSKNDITKYSDKERILVSKSENTREDVLDILSKDPKEIIRINVVNNPSTTMETLLNLLENEKMSNVKATIALSIRIPYDKLVEKYIDDNSIIVAKNLIINENCSLDVINKLYNHKDESVRTEVAKSSKTTKEIKEILQNDTHLIVRQSLPNEYHFDFDLKKIDDNFVSNPNNAKILAKILAEFRQFYTKDIFFNKNLHKDVLIELVKTKDENINQNRQRPGYFRHLALYHPNADLDVYKAFIEHSKTSSNIIGVLGLHTKKFGNGFEQRLMIEKRLKTKLFENFDIKQPIELNEYLYSLNDFNLNYRLVDNRSILNLTESILNKLESYFLKELENNNKEFDSFKISQLLKENLFSLYSLETIKDIVENNKKFKYNLNQINNKIDELKSLEIER